MNTPARLSHSGGYYPSLQDEELRRCGNNSMKQSRNLCSTVQPVTSPAKAGQAVCKFLF